MQNVGQHLQSHAQNVTGPDRDAFARSAYNRYYYACFLLLRDSLRAKRASWGRCRHQQYPDLLRRKVCRGLNEARKKAVRNGETDLLHLIGEAQTATREMAVIIKRAYEVRVVADYQPEIPVDFGTSSGFVLKGVDVIEARRWPTKVAGFIRRLDAAWRHVH